MSMKCNELMSVCPTPKRSKIKVLISIVGHIVGLGYCWVWPIVAYLFYNNHTDSFVNYIVHELERIINGQDYKSEFCCSGTIAELLSISVCIAIHYTLRQASGALARLSENKPVGS